MHHPVVSRVNDSGKVIVRDRDIHQIYRGAKYVRRVKKYSAKHPYTGPSATAANPENIPAPGGAFGGEERPSNLELTVKASGLEQHITESQARGGLTKYPSDLEFGLMLASAVPVGETVAGARALARVARGLGIGGKGTKIGPGGAGIHRGAAAAAEAPQLARSVRLGGAAGRRVIPKGVRARAANIAGRAPGRLKRGAAGTGKWVGQKPVRRGALSVVGGGAGLGAVRHPGESITGVAGVIGDIAEDPGKVGEAVDAAAKAVSLAPEALGKSVENLIFDKESREAAWESLPQLAIEGISFPFVLAKEAAARGPVGAAEHIGTGLIESAKTRWGPLDQPQPWTPEIKRVTAETEENEQGEEKIVSAGIEEQEWNAMTADQQFDELQRSAYLGGPLITLTEAAGVTSGVSHLALGAIPKGARAKVGLGERRQLRITRGEEGKYYQRASKGLVGRSFQELLDTARAVRDRQRQARTGKPTRGRGPGTVPEPRVYSRAKDEVVPLSTGKLLSRMQKRRAAGARAESELEGMFKAHSTTGRGNRRGPIDWVMRRGHKTDHWGLTRFESHLNQEERVVAAYMTESGTRTSSGVMNYMRERVEEIEGIYRESINFLSQNVRAADQRLRDARSSGAEDLSRQIKAVENAKGRLETLRRTPPEELGMLKNAIEQVQRGKLNLDKPLIGKMAEKYREVGWYEAEQSIEMHAGEVGMGDLATGEMQPHAKIAERAEGRGRLEPFEEVTGPTPVAREKAQVARATRLEARAKKAEGKAVRRTERETKGELRTAKAGRKKAEGAKDRAEKRAVETRNKVTRSHEAKAQRRADKESKAEIDEAHGRVVRIKGGVGDAQRAVDATKRAITARRQRDKPPTAKQKQQLTERTNLLASEKRRLKGAEKMERRAWANKKYRDRKYREEAQRRALADERISSAERSAAYHRRRTKHAEKREAEIQRRGEARVKQTRESMTKARKAAAANVARRRQIAEGVRVREVRRRGKDAPLEERSWSVPVDRRLYARKIGKQRIREAGGVEPGVEPGYIPDVLPRKNPLAHEMSAGLSRGRGMRASKGVLYRTGRRDLSSDALIDAHIKTQLSATTNQTIARIAAMADDLRGVMAGKGIHIPDRKLTREEVIEWIGEANRVLDALPDNISVMNMGKLTDRMRAAITSTKGEAPKSPEEINTILRDQIHKDVQDGFLRPERGSEFETMSPIGQLRSMMDEVVQNPDVWGQLEGWRIVDTNVARQIAPRPHDDPTINFFFGPEGILARTKSGASKLLLGLNPQWLGFQVYANMMLLGVAQPSAFFGSQFSFWLDHAKLDPAAKLAWERTVGVSPHMVDYGRFGESTLAGWIVQRAGMENSRAWHFMKGRSLLNPMFRLDYRNNRAFKGIFLHNKVKREAWDRMDQSMVRITGIWDRLVAQHLPGEAGKAGKVRRADYARAYEEVVKDRPLMEALGKEVDAWMGDYLRFTSSERSVLANNVMFYGFMRHSLTLALLTLPKNPIKASILMKLGQVALEDKREVMRRMLRGGLKAFIHTQPGLRDLNDADMQKFLAHYMQAEVDPRLEVLPLATLGDFYWQGEINLPGGISLGNEGWNKIGTSRAAALGNIVLEGGVLEEGNFWKIATVINPFVAAGIEMLSGIDTFTGQPLRFGGDAQGGFGAQSAPLKDLPGMALNAFFELAPPARGLQRGMSEIAPSKKAAGSVPLLEGFIPGLGEEGIEYADRTDRKAAEVANRRFRNLTGSPLEEVARTILPGAPQRVDEMNMLFSFLGESEIEGLGSGLRDWEKGGGYDPAEPWSTEAKDPYAAFHKDLGRYDSDSASYQSPASGGYSGSSISGASGSEIHTPARARGRGPTSPPPGPPSVRNRDGTPNIDMGAARRAGLSRREATALADVLDVSDVGRERGGQRGRGGQQQAPKTPKQTRRLLKDAIKAAPGTAPDAGTMAKAAVKYGNELGVSPSVLMAIGEIESGHGANTGTSSAGALGHMQFIQGTRDSILDEFGVDAYGPPEEAVHAAALLLKKGGFGDSAQAQYDAIFSYNHADWYVGDVLEKAAGQYASLDEVKPDTIGAIGGGPQKGPKPHRVRGFLKHVEISAGLPTAEDLGIESDKPILNNIHPKLQKALMKLEQTTGVKPIINEGFRTYEYQAQLAAVPGLIAAEPGQSKHESGLAVDLDNYDAFTEEQRAAVGLSAPVPGDPVHFQLINEPAALVGPLAGEAAVGATGAAPAVSTGGVSGASAPATGAPASAGGTEPWMPPSALPPAQRRQQRNMQNPLKMLELISRRDAPGGTEALVGLPATEAATEAEAATPTSALETALGMIGSAEDLRRRTLKRR